MKKYLALLLALVMVCTLMACGKNETSDKSDASATDAAQVQKSDAADAGDTTETADKQGTADDSSSTTTDAGDSGADEDFSVGIKESGEDIIVSAENDTPVGKASCVMTYKYSKDKLQTVTVEYVLADAAAAEELADDLDGNPDVAAGSISVKGTHVTCTLSDDTIGQLKEISRDDMLEALQYTESAM